MTFFLEISVSPGSLVRDFCETKLYFQRFLRDWAFFWYMSVWTNFILREISVRLNSILIYFFKTGHNLGKLLSYWALLLDISVKLNSHLIDICETEISFVVIPALEPPYLGPHWESVEPSCTWIRQLSYGKFWWCSLQIGWWPQWKYKYHTSAN